MSKKKYKINNFYDNKTFQPKIIIIVDDIDISKQLDKILK